MLCRPAQAMEPAVPELYVFQLVPAELYLPELGLSLDMLANLYPTDGIANVTITIQRAPGMRPTEGPSKSLRIPGHLSQSWGKIHLRYECHALVHAAIPANHLLSALPLAMPFDCPHRLKD